MKIWNNIKNYYLTHDGLEMFVFVCVFACFGFMAYHTVVGIIGRFF